jgi:hypothetical protein
LDIDDLKEGRLDRIEERQEKDPKAKDISVVIFIKERVVEHEYPWWYWPYRIEWVGPAITYTTSGNSYVTCSTAKWATTGSYTLGTGNTVNVR